ncbi:BTB/POZ domain-containing protein 16-like [Gigantopelta aegis]|uniref:BTB/POZ domain-containing protein 16-like n=1 Tax=Gigantopelta aegis TaxID=1735272 RepID=UPI001B88867F|nr:BTB/POZ domain-containing protein 16-like [Gigantopelta aegis]
MAYHEFSQLLVIPPNSTSRSTRPWRRNYYIKMAEVSRMLPQTQMTASYFPAIPPKAPKTSISYSLALNEAPYKSLIGILPEQRIPDKLSIETKYRIRNQTGLTNRWRHPDCLYSDLLGNSQALKSISMPYNTNLIKIITAESPRLSANLDSSKPYQYRESQDRRDHDSLTGKTLFSSPEPSFSRSKSMPVAGPVGTFIPQSAKLPKPKEVFLYHSNRKLHVDNPDSMSGDVLLHCLKMDWELHGPYIQKSETLAKLLKAANDPNPHTSYRNQECETIDSFINQSSFYSDEYRELSNKFTKELKIPAKENKIRKPNNSVCVTVKGRSMTKIKLQIDDPLVTQTAMAVALGNLYHDEIEGDINNIEGILAAASILQFKPLVEWCVKNMLLSISTSTVCKYHLAASKYKQEGIVAACERWLELNLIPQLANQIQLRELPIDILQKIIKSSKLFVYNEYSVYKTLALWIFLQLNPKMQLMPSHSSLLAFFNSLSKTSALVEIDEGQIFLPLFAAVRFHGILETNHIQDLKVMNILPHGVLVDVLTHHYHSLQGGGDMISVRPCFSTSAIRQGFIINDEPHYHSEVLSLHGFHFELKAIKEPDGRYIFYMQRLDPKDPVLTFKQCERQTFSMRRERIARYSITVQYCDNDEDHFYTTGILKKEFSIQEWSSKSKVLELRNVKKPTYVSFAVLFPPS